MKNTNAPSMASTAAPTKNGRMGWVKTYSWFGLILHEDAFEYGFIGRTGLYLVLKKQAEGLSDTQMPVSFILLILLFELYYFQ